jgi:uncharacterized repeat protein (TIGR01451 family)
MKNLILGVAICLSGLASAQTATIAVQFYIDANNNCTYNSGEQLISNSFCQLKYVNTGNTISTITGGYSMTTCGPTTLYIYNPSVTPTNTLTVWSSPNLSPNTGCGAWTNLPYNTNATIYLPVVISNTNILGTSMSYINYNSSVGSFTYTSLTGTNNSFGVCANIGNDSLAMNFTIYNYFSCGNTASMSPRTYSLFMDGVCYDKITVSTGLNAATFTSGVNNMSDAYEYYTTGSTYLMLYPLLPSTFSVIGSHTFEVKSTQLWNNTLSTMNFSCIINSIPCTKISGKFWFDCNNNCTFDGTDYYGVGMYATGKLYNALTGYNLLFHPNQYDGKFSVYVPSAGTYSLTQYRTYNTGPFSFTACSNGTTTILPNSTVNNLSYGYKNSSIATDPAVGFGRIASTSTSLSPLVGAQMGVYLWNNAFYQCSPVANNPGQVKVVLPSEISYLNMVTGPTPTVLSGTSTKTLVWNTSNFPQITSWWQSPFASFSVQVTNTAVPGSYISIQTVITPSVDGNLNNNSFNWTRQIGGPFDPNGKFLDSPGLMPNDEVSYGTNQFFYTIGFQNVGNAPAINVKTLDTIDVNFDLNSLDVMQSSFPVNVQLDQVSRQVQFHFDGINLPAASVDEPKSHGFVRYSIRLKPGVPKNTVLKNRAHNYFDFNEPVATNQTAHTLVVVGIDEFSRAGGHISAIPNPFGSALTISSGRKIESVLVIGLDGKVVKALNASSTSVELDMHELASAMYIIQVTDEEHIRSTIKVIKY